MRLGLTIFLTDQSIGAVDMARETEARGFSSLWFPEHTHIPASRRTPFPAPDGLLPSEYYRVVDPVVALTACAVATERLVLGSGISLVAQHDPIAYAKSWATLDMISGGRTRFGVGFGWNAEEMEAHGVSYPSRRNHARECVLAMQELWSSEPAGFNGEHISFEPTHSWPKPVQQPRIPTYVGGGGGPILFRHVAEYADGWLPIGGAGIRESLPKLQEAWAAHGRSGQPDVIPFGTVPSASKLDYYASLGCTEVVLRVPSVPRDEALRILDEFAGFVSR
jgi:probable F420-dependent oxidoreductase